jgi:hypothetical protein
LAVIISVIRIGKRPKFDWHPPTGWHLDAMTLRILASILLLALVIPCHAQVKEEGEEVGRNVYLVSAEFGLIEQDNSGAVTIKAVDKIPLTPGQLYGWRLKFRTKRQSLFLREEVQMPVAPKSWSNSIPDAEFKVSADGRTGITKADAVLVDGALMNAWAVAEGDPAGLYEIRLFIDGRLVRTFRFEAVAK